MRIWLSAASAILLITSLPFLAAACAGSSASIGGVTVEPLTPTRTAVSLAGGQPAPTETPPAPSPTASPEPVLPPTSTPVPRPSPTTPPDAAPSTGRWIEVDVTQFVVRLMDGETIVQEIGPVGVGEQIDTGEYLSTQTGLFYVHNKAEPLVYDAPYDTYISHWVGFDHEKDNGFHSFLKDADGNVVDASTGRVSNGCIRSGAAEAIFAYAEIGMPVWVHW